MINAITPAAFTIALPALIGLVAGAVGGVWAAWQRARVFEAEWKRAREDMVAAYAINLIREMATDLVRAAHAMWWLAWRARTPSHAVGTTQINEFELEVRNLLPKIHGAHAALQASHPRAAKELEALLKGLDALDLDFANCCADFRDGNPVPLRNLVEKAETFKDALPESIKGCSDWLGKTGWLDRPEPNEPNGNEAGND